MIKRTFRVSKMRSFSELRAERLMIGVEVAIRKEVDFRKQHNIVPARAPWRALKEALTPEEMDKLEAMVRLGIVKKYDGIHYPSYEMDYQRYAKFWEEMDKL